MKKINFKTVTVIIVTLLFVQIVDAQVKIGNNPNSIKQGSILELETGTKGVLFPRVSLADLNVWGLDGTGDATTAGMVVYNTNTTTGVGFYYWEGTKWVKFNAENSAWDVTGNLSTDSATSFLGTKDAQPLTIKTKDAPRMIVSSEGNVGVGTTTPQAKLDVIGKVRITDGSQGEGKVLTSDIAGLATWKSVGISIINGVNGSGVNISETEANKLNYTGSYIVLSPGKWRVFATGFIAYTGTNSIWVRTTLSDVAENATTHSSDIVGFYLMSGNAVNVTGSTTISTGPDLGNGYGTYNGSVIIHNTSSSDKTYYLEVGGVEGMQAGSQISRIGGSWGEDALFAFPVNN